MALDTYQAGPVGSGFEVKLKAHVVGGASQGGVFFADKVVQKFESPQFESAFQAPGDGKVMTGRKGGDGQYSVELDFPVGGQGDPREDYPSASGGSGCMSLTCRTGTASSMPSSAKR